MRALILILCIFPAVLWAQNAPGQITVTGEGQVAAAPDMATISLGVTSQAASASQALSQTNAATARVLDRLKAMGIAARDMQTDGLSLSPRWDQRSASGQEPTITGYVASNSVRVRVRDLSSLGQTLDTTVGLGANQFNGLNFGLQDPRPSTDKARRAAVADALLRARLYATAAGVELGAILSISEVGNARPPILEMRSMAAADAVPVAQGELTVSASVTVVFAIGKAP